ncbi:MAG: DNA repair protein RadA, partial [Pseudoalteromonas sp.]
MAKASKIEFVCTECGMNYQRWQGQCKCGAWNTLAEFKPGAGQSKSVASRAAVAGYAGNAGRSEERR